jgi:hypothetical protein
MDTELPLLKEFEGPLLKFPAAAGLKEQNPLNDEVTPTP